MANQSSSNSKTLHLMIHGTVQGVYFRQSMLREAQNLGISGWVRNLSDGTVESVVHGDPGAVDAMVRWAKRGPERARVERVDEYPTEGDFTNFEVMN